MALKMPPPMADSSSSAAACALFSSLVAAEAAAAAAEDRVEVERKGAAAFADPSPLGLSPLPREVSEAGPDGEEPSGADPKEERRCFSIEVLPRRRFLDDKPAVFSRAPFPAPDAAAPAAGPRGRATRSD